MSLFGVATKLVARGLFNKAKTVRDTGLIKESLDRIDAVLPPDLIKKLNRQFIKEEAQVRNMPIGYNEGFGPITRKGQKDTEKMIKELRSQQAAGVISGEERRQILLKEIEGNTAEYNRWLLRRELGDFGMSPP